MVDFFTLYLTLIAPVVGSFLGMLYMRLPEGQALTGRSRCDTCKTQLGLRDLIPLISYLAQLGRCRTCKSTIPISLWIIELLALVLVLPIWFLFDPFTQIATAGLSWALLLLAALDRKHLWLPNSITLPLIAAGLLLSAKGGTALLVSHALAGIGAYLFIWLLNFLYIRLRGRDGIGMGDAKLLAAAGVWLGPIALPWVLLIASGTALIATVMGQVFGKHIEKETEIPLGLYLAFSFWLIWLISTQPTLAILKQKLLL